MVTVLDALADLTRIHVFVDVNIHTLPEEFSAYVIFGFVCANVSYCGCVVAFVHDFSRIQVNRGTQRRFHVGLPVKYNTSLINSKRGRLNVVWFLGSWPSLSEFIILRFVLNVIDDFDDFYLSKYIGHE